MISSVAHFDVWKTLQIEKNPATNSNLSFWQHIRLTRTSHQTIKEKKLLRIEIGHYSHVYVQKRWSFYLESVAMRDFVCKG